VRLFRSLLALWSTPYIDPADTPAVGSTTPLYARTPQAKVRGAYRDAREILEHLMQGFSASRDMMQSAGMSNRRWGRAVFMLKAAGVIAATEERQRLQLIVYDWEWAEELLERQHKRMMENVRKPNYRLPFV